MKWVNHMLIAGTTTAVVAPALVPVALLGSTAPDWMEWVSKGLGKPIKHRTTTHIVFVLDIGFSLWISCMGFSRHHCRFCLWWTHTRNRRLANHYGRTPHALFR